MYIALYNIFILEIYTYYGNTTNIEEFIILCIVGIKYYTKNCFHYLSYNLMVVTEHTDLCNF